MYEQREREKKSSIKELHMEKETKQIQKYEMKERKKKAQSMEKEATIRTSTTAMIFNVETKKMTITHL